VLFRSEAGVTPSEADFNKTRVGRADGVSADAKPPDVVSKAEEDEEDEKHEDGETAEEEGAEKSLTAGDLQKSLDRLTALATEGDAPSRKETGSQKT